MKRLVRTYIIVLSVLTIISAKVVSVFYPEHYPSLLFTIPVFYAVMLGVMALIRRAVENQGKQDLDNSVCKKEDTAVLAFVFNHTPDQCHHSQHYRIEHGNGEQQ